MANQYFEIESLEELILDELEFKVRSVIMLLDLNRYQHKELIGIVEVLESISRENQKIISKYV